MLLFSMLFCKANFKFIYALAGEEVLPEGMTAVLSSAVKLVECNPRGMKRIVNLLQIIFVLGRIRPHDDLLSFAPIAFSQEKEEWDRFLNKCVLWIVLCQYFPYRVSLLVQILLDFDQKINFNAKASSMMDCSNPPREFAYRNNSSKIPPLKEKMTIYNFYMLHVDKFVKAFDKSDKFCRVDKDPEEFAALLQRTASFSDKNLITGEDSITCEDVLGPASEFNRDKTFSLLSYSFNLDPAIRNEVLFSGWHNYDHLHILMISFSATDWRGDRFCGVGFRAVYEGQQ